MLLEILETLEHKVIEAFNGSEAIALAKTHLPDTILMDKSIPGMSGQEVTKLLRQHFDYRLATMPIITITNQLVNHRREQH
ncbi:response regulator [Cohaesibacter celericrescens]|uniref:Response regulatory domain-containing protein n=1 Tax=Cohaesibacter celericrescens TaxID=2067669 RepID=A0A2N5XUM4_9HYPH|nr:hypothetical protein C0081_04975 [Cohaesibacter celericrescens]